MKKLLCLAALALVGSVTLPIYGQAFVNLDFESAQVIPVSGQPDNAIVTADALPGWTVFYQFQQETNIAYNGPGFSVFYGASLEETNSRVLDGNFSLALTYGVMISQTGVVPSGTESMFFSLAGTPYQYGTTFSVSMDGQNLSYYPELNATNSAGEAYTIYAADVSAFSNQNVTLEFSSTRAGVIAIPTWDLDDIEFSPLPVPEPGTFAMISLGTILLGFQRWRKLKGSS